jgi:hypothetical protein
MEPLHRLLDIATDAGILSRLRGKKCTFRASLYADDVALFINPTVADISGIQGILHAFGMSTGLQTNFEKSSATPIRCQHLQLSGILNPVNIQIAEFPCQYLGMPLSIKKLTKAEWQFLLYRVDIYLATWKARLMSKAGRLQLLNSVLTSHISSCIYDDYT